MATASFDPGDSVGVGRGERLASIDIRDSLMVIPILIERCYDRQWQIDDDIRN